MPQRPLRRSIPETGCREERRVRDARGETGPPAQSRARATYVSDVSELNAIASLSLFLPLCSSSSTTASSALASIFAPPQRYFKRLPPKLLANRTRCQRRFTRLAPLPHCRPLAYSASAPCEQAWFPRCVPVATRTARSRVACSACAIAPRAYPRPPATLRAAGLWNLSARAPLCCSTRPARLALSAAVLLPPSLCSSLHAARPSTPRPCAAAPVRGSLFCPPAAQRVPCTRGAVLRRPACCCVMTASFT